MSMSFGANLLRTFRVLGIGIFVLITFKSIFSKQMLDCDTARPPMLTTSSLPLKTQEIQFLQIATGRVEPPILLVRKC